MSYRRSPTLSAVLRDLEDTERHRRCEGYVWRYDAGTFTCDSCGVRRRSIEQTVYTERDGGLSTGHAIMRGGPQVRLSPGLGADCVSRRLRP
jgi:hypothetical protein